MQNPLDGVVDVDHDDESRASWICGFAESFGIGAVPRDGVAPSAERHCPVRLGPVLLKLLQPIIELPSAFHPSLTAESQGRAAEASGPFGQPVTPEMLQRVERVHGCSRFLERWLVTGVHNAVADPRDVGEPSLDRPRAISAPPSAESLRVLALDPLSPRGGGGADRPGTPRRRWP